MSRWFRHYAGMMRDAKLVSAAVKSKQPIERVVWLWGAILESAAEINDNGKFALDTAEAAYFLRAEQADLDGIVECLRELGRLRDDRVAKWGDRQFQSDVSTDRVRSHRDRQRNSGNRERNWSVDRRNGDETEVKRSSNAPETDTELEAEKNTEAKASDAPASPVYTDATHELWNEGVGILGQLGVADKPARSNIGRWLKDTKNDAPAVLAAIQRARHIRSRDPIPFVTGALKSGPGPPRRGAGFLELALQLDQPSHEQPNDILEQIPNRRSAV